VPPPELRRRADELTEHRARKRLGPAAEAAPGRLSHRAIHPFDVAG